MKECKICKKNMPLSNFHKRNSSKDGYVEKCKNCVKEYTTNYYKELEKIKCEICQENKPSKSYSSKNSNTCSSCKLKQGKINATHIKCKFCKTKKEKIFFVTSKITISGYRSICKNCKSKYASEYHKNNTSEDLKKKKSSKIKAYYHKRFFHHRAYQIITRNKKEKISYEYSVFELAVFLSKQWKIQNGSCLVTNERLYRNNAVVDHIIPISRGGNSNFDNLRWVIKEFNDIKGGFLDSEFKELEFVSQAEKRL